MWKHYINPTLIKITVDIKCVTIALQANSAFSTAAMTGSQVRVSVLLKQKLRTVVVVIGPCSCPRPRLTVLIWFTLLSFLLSSHGIW